MVKGTALVRQGDGKLFNVVLPSHWSEVESADGERDFVKCYGGSPEGDLYVSRDDGHSYRVSSAQWNDRVICSDSIVSTYPIASKRTHVKSVVFGDRVFVVDSDNQTAIVRLSDGTMGVISVRALESRSAFKVNDPELALGSLV